MITDSTPIWQLTVGQLKEIVKDAETPIIKAKPHESDEFVYGISGLAQIIGASRTTAQKLKSSGRIDEAITQVGRQIIINKNKVLTILKNHTK